MLLISTESLQQQLNNDNLVIFDCRYSLKDEHAGRSAYLAAHLPNAHYLDLKFDLSSPVGEHGGRHPLPDPAEFAAKLGAAGVDDDAKVVVYDDNNGMAARAWWLLRYFGHENVSILNGGMRAWKAEGLALTTEIPDVKNKQFHVRVHDDWVVTTDEMERIVSGTEAARLVDARAAARYRGDMEPLDPVAGHIPGARNAPWQDAFTEEGFWKGPDEQRARFTDELHQLNPLVMYCGSGVTACINLFSLALAGVTSPRLYAGSWSDWCSYPAHKVSINND